MAYRDKSIYINIFYNILIIQTAEDIGDDWLYQSMR